MRVLCPAAMSVSKIMRVVKSRCDFWKKYAPDCKVDLTCEYIAYCPCCLRKINLSKVARRLDVIDLIPLSRQPHYQRAFLEGLHYVRRRDTPPRKLPQDVTEPFRDGTYSKRATQRPPDDLLPPGSPVEIDPECLQAFHAETGKRGRRNSAVLLEEAQYNDADAYEELKIEDDEVDTTMGDELYATIKWERQAAARRRDLDKQNAFRKLNDENPITTQLYNGGPQSRRPSI